MEVSWGIIPDLGATARLPRLVGIGRAKELAFTARKVGAEEAAAWGLVNRVTPAGEHIKQATEWARELAAGPPLALASMKRLMTASLDVPIATGLEREQSAQRAILASSDFIEAVTARIQKRAPEFRAR
jgi:enoyl-CoA hydratase/carnithine racemase